jgi:hypothetical protein
VAAVALVAVDAADRNACELFEIGMMGPGRASLGVQHELAALGAVTGVAMELCT